MVKKLIKIAPALLGILAATAFLKSFGPISSEPGRTLSSENTDATSYGWKLVFSDEFEDAAVAIANGAPASCFSGPTVCLHQAWTQKDCDPALDQQLKNLNKCTWRIYNFTNWMDNEATSDNAVNAFDASTVKVENGKLILNTIRSPFKRNELDCKREIFDPEVGGTQKNFTKKCLVWSGGIESNPFWRNGKLGGWDQEFGRIEVRAKLFQVPGTWPAHWMLATGNDPAGCGYPFNGEIDIMEATDEGLNDGKMTSCIHEGICSERIKLDPCFTGKIKKVYPDMSKEKRGTTLYREFHTYAIEWSKDAIRFFLDDYEIGTSSRLDTVEGEQMDENGQGDGKKNIDRPMEIPTGAHYMLLNSSVQPKAYDEWSTTAPGKLPEDRSAADARHEIDYVRGYQRCTASDDPKLCLKIKTRDTIYGYNTHKNESASVFINAFPSPLAKGTPLSVRMTPDQDCEDLKLSVVNMLGQFVTISSPDVESSNYIYKGPVIGGKDYNYTVETGHMAAGMYLVTAFFSKCGPEGAGKGNQVFKALVL